VHEVIYHFLNLFPRRSPKLIFRSKFWHDKLTMSDPSFHIHHTGNS
jgi:hypothetical protein